MLSVLLFAFLICFGTFCIGVLNGLTGERPAAALEQFIGNPDDQGQDCKMEQGAE